MEKFRINPIAFMYFVAVLDLQLTRNPVPLLPEDSLPGRKRGN